MQRTRTSVGNRHLALISAQSLNTMAGVIKTLDAVLDAGDSQIERAGEHLWCNRLAVNPRAGRGGGEGEGRVRNECIIYEPLPNKTTNNVQSVFNGSIARYKWLH